MPYVRVPQPDNLPPKVAAAVERLERQYLREVHVMLRLPLPHYRLSSDCSFSCAQVLLALVSGISTILFAHRDSKPGPDFKDLLLQFYPWDMEPLVGVSARDATRLMYEVFRNPLVHNLGAHVRPRGSTPLVKIKRARRAPGGPGLTERYIESLEREVRPKLSAVLVVRPGDATVLFVEPLYWGVRVMLARLLRDAHRIAGAETFLRRVT